MGQLERYGLYVLVLVIFLILGVAIWGGEPSPANAAVDPQALARVGGLSADPERALGDARRGNFTEAAPPPVASADDDLDDLVEVEVRADQGGQANATPEPGPKPAPPATEVGGFDVYKIKSGDTFSGIAKRVYGTQNGWQGIRDANPGIDPKRMPLGREIRIPRLADGARSSGRSADRTPVAGTSHKVVPGDNPAKISKRYYQTEAHASLIMKANRIADPTKLQLGAVLVIPELPAKPR